MHIPDGFLNGTVSGPLLAGALGALGHAFVRVRRALTRRVAAQRLATIPPSDAGVVTRSVLTDRGRQQVLRMASLGALIFAAQMVNFPVANGTSGHLLGGALAAIVLGPWAGLLVMGVVLGVQALLFGDGGILAFGANVVNMGLIGTVGAWGLFRWLRLKPFALRAGLVAWATVVLASAGASVELALSGTAPFARVLTAMVSVHALIGIGEALITIGALWYLRRQGMRFAADETDDADL